MFVHKELVELEEKVEKQKGRIKSDKIEIENLERRIWKMEVEEKLNLRGRELKTEEALNELRKEMQKDLIESDLRRVKAEACLETYKAMDTKTDREQIRKMLDKAITSLGQKVAVQVVK